MIKTKKPNEKWDSIVLRRIQDTLGVACFEDSEGKTHFVDHDVVILSQGDKVYNEICRMYRMREDWQTYMFRHITDRLTSRLCETFKILDAISGNIDTWEEVKTIWP